MLQDAENSINLPSCRPEPFIASKTTTHFNKLNSKLHQLTLMPDLKLKSYEGSDAGNGPKTE